MLPPASCSVSAHQPFLKTPRSLLECEPLVLLGGAGRGLREHVRSLDLLRRHGRGTDHGCLDDVCQLPDVARPLGGLECVQRTA
jgi:hypothetical protein